MTRSSSTLHVTIVTGLVGSSALVAAASFEKYGTASGLLVVASLATDHMMTEGQLRSLAISSASAFSWFASNLDPSATWSKLMDTAGASAINKMPCSSASRTSSSLYG